MHKSKLAGFIIDCDTDDLERAAEFWGKALGMKLHHFEGAEGENYIKLDHPQESLHIEVQKVTHASRVHLDIETDDIEEEVARLRALGAVEVQWTRGWCVMEAPTGQCFCVVKKCTPDFETNANEW